MNTSFLETLNVEEVKAILKETIKIIINFYSLYYSKQKEIPTVDELIAVLMYELELSREQIYEILDVLNYKGILLWDGKRWQINYKMLMIED